MPIVLTPFGVDPLWGGSTWSVPDEDMLASWIAWVALGQAHHVARILHAASPSAPLATNQDAISDAVALLTKTGGDPSHRDGWMFQVMSWLAAHQRTPGGLIALPHMIHAEKGLDGLEIMIDAEGVVQATIIFEDKATINPRDTIRDKVWPEFARFESGAGTAKMTQQAAAILTAANHPDPSRAVSKIVWKTSRRYRVSITADKSTTSSRKSLFKGYEVTVPGNNDRRSAEVFAIADMRNWMDQLALKAILKAKAM